jgi:hypothetical protein
MLAEYAYINERLFHIFRGMWLVELYPYENVDLFCTHNMLVSILSTYTIRVISVRKLQL